MPLSFSCVTLLFAAGHFDFQPFFTDKLDM